MATFHRVAAALFVLLGLFAIAASQAGNETDIDIEYGNFTDGNFTDGNFTDDVSCSDLGCTGPGSRCMENDTYVVCACMEGYRLKSDMRTCERCPGGTFGLGCLKECNCGDGNTCHRVTGVCICNTCWTGTNCSTAVGGTCLVDFLSNPVKNEDSLRDTYGAQSFPTVASIYKEEAFAVIADIGTLDRDIILTTLISTESREDVGQGPLFQIKASLGKTQGSAAVANALTTLENKVKVGDLAVTLIIQDSQTSTTAEVTINAGIKREE